MHFESSLMVDGIITGQEFGVEFGFVGAESEAAHSIRTVDKAVTIGW